MKRLLTILSALVLSSVSVMAQMDQEEYARKRREGYEAYKKQKAEGLKKYNEEKNREYAKWMSQRWELSLIHI